MTAALATLNQAALVTLADCEQRIERGLRSFYEIGEALGQIRDSRLYRATYENFEDYCRDRWDFGRDYADRVITAAALVPTIVSKGLPAPTNEGQARALAAVPPAERVDVWREVIEGDGKPTAEKIRKAAEARTAPPADRTKTPEPAAETTAQVGSGTSHPDMPPGEGQSAGLPSAAATAEESQGGVVAAEAADQLPGERHLHVVPPPGSPATWTPEQIEANKKVAETRRMRESGRRKAGTLVTTISTEIYTVTAAVELGERGLVTAEMVTQLREAVDHLASFVEEAQ